MGRLAPAFLTVIASLVLATLQHGVALAQDKLADAARNEKGIVLYGSPNTDDLNFLVNVFTKKHPFVKSSIYRATSAAVFNKIMAESRAGRRAFDAVIVSGFEIHLLKKAGLFEAYLPREIHRYPAGFKDSEGYWTAFFSNTHVISYNTRQVKAEDAPKKYEDLLQPAWKGRLMMHSEDYEWFTNQLLIRGEENGLKLMRGLANQNIIFRRGHTLILQLVAAGEAAASVNSYAYRAERLKQDGAPVRWVGVEPIVANLLCIALAKNGPNPNSARLFIEFATSKEGQTIVSQKFQRVPAHMDVEANPPTLTRGLKLWPSNPELGERIGRYGKLFRETFGLN
ncbi:MAG: extracellular solute-binding protein [Deltaproteobacteria bacterium]|nr:extracellular solute-binding protein [Deltaproteobacteria bacterium]